MTEKERKRAIEISKDSIKNDYYCKCDCDECPATLIKKDKKYNKNLSCRKIVILYSNMKESDFNKDLFKVFYSKFIKEYENIDKQLLLFEE